MTDLRWLDGPPDEPTRDGLHALVAAVAATGGAVGWLHVPERAEVDAWVDSVRGRFVVAELDGRVVGCGTWQGYEGTPVLQGLAEVRKVMTAPDVRGRGVARAVTVALVEDARARGVEVLTLDCRGNNHAAQALYASLGFVVTGRRPDVLSVDEHRFDQVLMHLDLRRGPSGLVRHGSRREGPGST